MTLKTFGHVDIEIGPSLGATKVRVNNEDFPCTRVSVSVNADDQIPRVELETVRLKEDEPVRVSGLLVEDAERLKALEEVAQWAAVVTHRLEERGLTDAGAASGVDLLAKALDRLHA